MILVLSTYRSGSTNLCSSLAESTGYDNKDELFHENVGSEHMQRLRDLEKQNFENVIVKIFPYHIKSSPVPNLLNLLVEKAERIICLVRPNFDQQCQSYYIAKHLNDFHSQWDDTTVIKYDAEDWRLRQTFIHNEVLTLSDWYSEYNCELLWTHQIAGTMQYSRPVMWDRKPGYTNIDTEELFY
jgi:hypothetical protein